MAPFFRDLTARKMAHLFTSRFSNHISATMRSQTDVPVPESRLRVIPRSHFVNNSNRITQTGIFETVEVTCGFDGCTTNQAGLESCWPIPVPDDDPDFRYNRCLKFVRSQEVPPLDCHLGLSTESRTLAKKWSISFRWKQSRFNIFFPRMLGIHGVFPVP